MLKTEDLENFENGEFDENENLNGNVTPEENVNPNGNVAPENDENAVSEEVNLNETDESNEDVATNILQEVKKEEAEAAKEEEKKSLAEEAEKVSMQNAVIDKIKTFLSKIAEMQKEAAEGDEENKDDDSATTQNKSGFIPEYYDLPYRYNETVVRVLAQTPQKLFVYWDISDNDRRKYEETFGQDFYYKTYPVLLLYNQDKQYVREIEVNDFANSWYINIDDPKTKYIIQLGRKFRTSNPDVDYGSVNAHNIILRNDYLPYAESNMMEAPNDHVLLEALPDYLTFRNVKTGEEMLVNVRELRTIFGNAYDVKGFYDEHYKDELDGDRFDMSNPSSGGLKGLNSSTFK